MDKKSLHRLLNRPAEANKYDFGHVLILGGSEEMVGAPVLAARAALRSGAGLVSIASTEETVRLIDRDIEEVMTLILPPWSEIENSIETIKTFIKKRQVSVLVIGPGLPTAADPVVRDLLSKVECPMVLDAEVFTALSGHLQILQTAAHINKSIILTPHPGEYARLIKDKPLYAIDDKYDALEKFAYDYNVALILKHHHSFVVAPGKKIYRNTTGNPGLATAGAGDVLTGIIAGILAQKIEPYEAAILGVHLHGLAGDLAMETNTEPGMIASDIIDFLPNALKKLEYQ